MLDIIDYEFRTNTTCEGPHYSLDDSKALLLGSTIEHCNGIKECSMVVVNNCDEPDLKFFYCINGTPTFSSSACSWVKYGGANGLKFDIFIMLRFSLQSFLVMNYFFLCLHFDNNF